ncbi:uncharacterized protein [Physcomitrium patens]|uniref:Uncharacterized protein n=2 Tax=Physcomitrium patens TaxID=3218 RepID=A0A2K1J926_PHYPA|nr:hypothetical protein PHYPA_021142 [Physcomitrium patens]
MLTIEVQLPEQEDRKKIEWNKVGDPTFDELKGRLQQCGVPDDWCVEVLRGSNFILPDLQTHIHGPKITVRASPILGYLRNEQEHQDDIQWSRWMRTAFEKVIAHVGRVYLVDTTKEEEVKDARAEERCVGTVGLMDVHGESICALHCIYPAVENPEKYKIYVSFPNYHKGCLSFEAKTRAVDENVDVCVIAPVQPLKKPYVPATYLDLATDVREDDIVYCFFYPKDPLKHVTPSVLHNLLPAEKNHPLRDAPGRKSKDLPTIITGTVCFSEWMQGVAAYERPPDCNGGILVSSSGRVKGIHVKAFTCGELRAKSNSDNPEELRVARKLCKKMSTYAPSDGIPVFVPPHGLVRLLGLEGGCELLQAAIRQHKVKPTQCPVPKQPKLANLRRSTRSSCSTPRTLTRSSNKRRKLNQ